jgi:hypothetical protein
MYTANNRAPIYMKQTLTELKGALLYNKNRKCQDPIFDKMKKNQDMINKYVSNLNNTNNQLIQKQIQKTPIWNRGIHIFLKYT